MVANGFEGVPWMIDGALTSADVSRIVSFAAVGGQEGILAPGDLKVSATPGTTDGYVHMTTGACAIRNRAANAFSQMYIGRAKQVSDIPIPSTGGSGRSDLIVARIEDPQYGKYAAPADIDNGPYIFPRVISGVPAGTIKASQLGGIYVNESMYAVARIDIPPSTTKIDGSMIKDLRKLARARSWTDSSVQAGPTPDQHLRLVDTSFINWPSNTWAVDVPDWTTWMQLRIDLPGIASDGNGAYFNPRISIAGGPGGTIYVPTTPFDYNGGKDGQGGERLPFSFFAELDATALAGSRITIRPQAARGWTDSATGDIWYDKYSQVLFEARFQERVV